MRTNRMKNHAALKHVVWLDALLVQFSHQATRQDKDASTTDSRSTASPAPKQASCRWTPKTPSSPFLSSSWRCLPMQKDTAMTSLGIGSFLGQFRTTDMMTEQSTFRIKIERTVQSSREEISRRWSQKLDNLRQVCSAGVHSLIGIDVTEQIYVLKEIPHLKYIWTLAWWEWDFYVPWHPNSIYQQGKTKLLEEWLLEPWRHSVEYHDSMVYLTIRFPKLPT